MSAIISYKNGNWKSAEIRKDKNGYFSRGPDISQLPEIVSFLNQIGIQAKSASPDLSISKLVFRFSAHYLNASLMVLGGAVPGKVVTNNRQAVVDYLSADSSFSDYFCQSGGVATGLYAWYETSASPFAAAYPNQDSPGIGRLIFRLDDYNNSTLGSIAYNFDDGHHYTLRTSSVEPGASLLKVSLDGTSQVVYTDFELAGQYERRYGLQYVGSGKYVYYAWPNTLRVISTSGAIIDTVLAEELDISAFFYYDSSIVVIDGTGVLSRVNTSTGAVTPIGDPGIQFESAASVDGVVYAVYVQDNQYVIGTVDMDTLELSTLGFWAYGNYLVPGPTYDGAVTTCYASSDDEKDQFSSYWWESQFGEGGGDGPGGYDWGIAMEMKRSNFPITPISSNLNIQYALGGNWTDVTSYEISFTGSTVRLRFVAPDRDQGEEFMRYRYTDQEAGLWSWSIYD